MQCKEFPEDVQSFESLLTKGVFYGRLRLNSFAYRNNNESYDQEILGIGGSFGYKSAYLYGLGFTAIAYSSQELWHGTMDDLSHYKAGKDILSRYDAINGGRHGINTLAQAFIEYKDDESSLKVGRQVFESFLTKSNDTKMIPNTFTGVTVESRRIPSSRLKVALLTSQKLRDHSSFHHLLAYGDNPKDPHASWTENDDGAMHRGLTLSKLESRGIEDRLLIFDLKNNTFANTTLNFNYTSVPELISSLMVEGSYRFIFGDFKIIPSLRYMKQFDNGAGAIGGANLRNNTVGYRNSESLESSLFASRVDFVKNIWSVRFGYSSIEDGGDLLAPWRGFPTGGYTRAMGQYNWYANTDTYMLRADYNLGRAGWLPKTRAMMRYAIQDFDDKKAGVQSDTQVLTFDLIKKGFDFSPNLYGKFRMAHVVGEDDTVASDGTLKPDPSYNEFRLEFNYLF